MDEELMCESLMKWVSLNGGIPVDCHLSISLFGDIAILKNLLNLTSGHIVVLTIDMNFASIFRARRSVPLKE